MKSIATKIIALSFIVLAAACSEKEEKEAQNTQNEEVSQEKKSSKAAPLSQFKATTPRDKSTYKSPSF